jgi:hypothetical protein
MGRLGRIVNRIADHVQRLIGVHLQEIHCPGHVWFLTHGLLIYS